MQDRVLFDSGATHLFTSPYFVNKLARKKIIMKVPLAIGTPLGESIEVRFLYLGCVVKIGERALPVDLIELVVFDFDVILGMDWLLENCASIDYNDKYVRFRSKEGTEFVFQGDRTKVPSNLISALKASRLLEKGCQGYLA